MLIAHKWDFKKSTWPTHAERLQRHEGAMFTKGGLLSGRGGVGGEAHRPIGLCLPCLGLGEAAFCANPPLTSYLADRKHHAWPLSPPAGRVRASAQALPAQQLGPGPPLTPPAQQSYRHDLGTCFQLGRRVPGASSVTGWGMTRAPMTKPL